MIQALQAILHIAPSYKPATYYGGPTVSVACLAEEQVRQGARVTIFTTTANGPGELPVPAGKALQVDGVTVFYFKRLTGDHGHFSPALYRALWRQTQHFPVIHLHSWWNWVVFGTLFICRIQGKRTMVSPRGMLSPYTMQSRTRRIFQKMLGAWLLKNSVLYATSKQEQLELQALHPGQSVVLAPNIIFFPKSLPARPLKTSRQLQLLYFSRIDPKKGLDILFQALSEIQPLDWKLCIAGATGSGYQAQLKRLSVKLGLAERVEWLGWIDGNQKWPLLAQSDLLVLPSHNENFANCVVEALAVGTPVVVSNQVGLYHYVQERELGWVAATKVDALQEVLQQAFADAPGRERISQQAPERVKTDFEPGKIARLYFQLYEQHC